MKLLTAGAVAVCGVLLALSGLHPAHAESERELADRFVRLLRYDEQYRDYEKQCLSTAGAVSPEALVRQSPERFFGIKPGSKYWPDIVAAYEAFYLEACERPTEEEFLNALAEAYAEELSLEEIREALAFYSGSTGQRLVGAHKAATRNVYQAWKRYNAEQIPRASANFDRRLLEIGEKALSER
jgi:hypothetical protein